MVRIRFSGTVNAAKTTGVGNAATTDAVCMRALISTSVASHAYARTSFTTYFSSKDDINCCYRWVLWYYSDCCPYGISCARVALLSIPSEI